MMRAHPAHALIFCLKILKNVSKNGRSIQAFEFGLYLNHRALEMPNEEAWETR